MPNPPAPQHRADAVVPWQLRLIGAAISVLLVGAVVGLLTLTGHPAGGEVSGRHARKTPPTASRPPASATPSPSTPVAPATPPTPGARPSPTRPPARPSTAPVVRAPLTVLNNSTIVGLAGESAARFRAAGWSIAAVGGIQGRYRYTTVYYGPGQLEAAQALVRQFPGIKVIDSRANAPELPGTGLTVVVTKDFR